MSTASAKDTFQTSAHASVEKLAESIWRLPPRQREALGDVLEEKFVKNILRRVRQIPRLRKEKKLLSLKDIERTFSRG